MYQICFESKPKSNLWIVLKKKKLISYHNCEYVCFILFLVLLRTLNIFCVQDFLREDINFASFIQDCLNVEEDFSYFIYVFYNKFSDR